MTASTVDPRPRRLRADAARNRARVLDAAQEVFAKAWSHRAQFNGTTSLSTWLTRIALNHFSTRIKRDRLRLRSFSGEIDEQTPGRSNPRMDAETNEAYLLASDCVRRLSRVQREAFVLRYFEELSYAEAAEVLGVPEGTVRARAFEARKHLREMLKEYEL